MIAEGVRDTELAAYQRAARTLLVNPLITTTRPTADTLPLVRRFAAPLARDLAEVAGYRLELAPTCARLIRRFDRVDATQAVQPRDRKPFDRRRYAYLCLVLGALGRAGTQVALRDLADTLRRRAAEIEGLGFDPDVYRHRLAFVDVVTHLTELGVLRVVEETPVAWVSDPDGGDVLYDVDRDAVHLAFVPPRVVQHVTTVRAFLATSAAGSRDTRRADTRQRLARLLLEHPVVYFDDLDDTERTYLMSQARSLGDDLQRLTGAQLERRAEGLALIDGTGGFSDHRFPAGGTPNQAALLIADVIAARVADGDVDAATVPSASDALDGLIAGLDAARPSAPVAADPAPRADVPAPEPAAGPFFSDAWLREQAARLCRAYGRAFSADLRDDPAAVAAAAVEVLAEFDLARSVPGGVVARPAIARFRDVRVTEAVTAPSRSHFEHPREL
jgi:uncharacterized protein (TIGR02678 family)